MQYDGNSCLYRGSGGNHDQASGTPFPSDSRSEPGSGPRAPGHGHAGDRSPQFGLRDLAKAVFDGSRKIFKTSGPVIIFPSSGPAPGRAAIVNTLSPGDKVLMVETGHFATLWRQMAGRWGIDVDFMPGDWRHGADPAAIEARLAQDTSHAIKAVMVVHNETSTGVTSRVGGIRAAMDKVVASALLMVDTISSLGLGRLPA